MNNAQIYKPVTLLPLLFTTSIAGLAIYAWYLAIRLPHLATLKGRIFTADMFTALPFAFINGLALSLVFILFWNNRHRLRVVFGFNWGRLIGAACLLLIAPIALAGPLPVTFFFTVTFTLNIFTSLIWELRLDTLFSFFRYAGTVILGLAVCYPISCFFVSGIKNKLLRGAAYSLAFSAIYSGHVLWNGIERFVL